MRPDLLYPVLWSCWVTPMSSICFNGMDCFHVRKLQKARLRDDFCSRAEISQGRTALPGNVGMRGMFYSSLPGGCTMECCTHFLSAVSRARRTHIPSISHLNLSVIAELVKILNTGCHCGAWIICNWALDSPKTPWISGIYCADYLSFLILETRLSTANKECFYLSLRSLKFVLKFPFYKWGHWVSQSRGYSPSQCKKEPRQPMSISLWLCYVRLQAPLEMQQSYAFSCQWTKATWYKI